MTTFAGVLAGLDEFPTYPNIDASLTKDELTKIPYRVLSTLLGSPLSKTAPQSKSNDLRITRTKQVGDIQHLFSHIKKTYRAQWVVLQGGGPEPPTLKVPTAPPPSSSKKGKKKVEKGDTPTARWVRLDEVSDAKYVFL